MLTLLWIFAMFSAVLNLDCKLCNDLFTVILVLSSTSFLTDATEIMDNSFTVNKPVLRNNNPQPWVLYSSDYVRCFCNLPSCVHTGYMCKSSGGGCFSDLWSIAGFPTGYRGRHGCLELLNHNDKTCVNITDTKKIPTKRRNFPKPFIHCCYSDMCNHVDSPQTKYLINTTLLGESNDLVLENVSNHRTIGYSNSEVWFRAATIAVPICGAVILFVLIAMAIKILRNERHNSYNHKLESPMYIQQIPIREKNCYKYQRGLQYDCLKNQHPRSHNPIYRPTTVELLDYQKNSQVPLLLQNEIRNSQSDCKNETHAKLNQLHSDSYPGYLRSGGKSIILEIEKEGSANCPRNNIDNKNINDDVKFCDIKYGDKNYPKDSPIV